MSYISLLSKTIDVVWLTTNACELSTYIDHSCKVYQHARSAYMVSGDENELTIFAKSLRLWLAA